MRYPKVLYSCPERSGEKFRPSNGTEGMTFTEAFCERCIHEKWTHTQNDNDAKCEILSATMLYDFDDEKYPNEWQYGDDGYPICTEWKHWDWGGRNGDDINDPPPPPIDDPRQLVMLFLLDEIVKEKEELEVA